MNWLNLLEFLIFQTNVELQSSRLQKQWVLNVFGICLWNWLQADCRVHEEWSFAECFMTLVVKSEFPQGIKIDNPEMCEGGGVFSLLPAPHPCPWEVPEKTYSWLSMFHCVFKINSHISSKSCISCLFGDSEILSQFWVECWFRT